MFRSAELTGTTIALSEVHLLVPCEPSKGHRRRPELPEPSRRPAAP